MKLIVVKQITIIINKKLLHWRDKLEHILKAKRKYKKNINLTIISIIIFVIAIYKYCKYTVFKFYKKEYK